jgi:hypothetical protein
MKTHDDASPVQYPARIISLSLHLPCQSPTSLQLVSLDPCLSKSIREMCIFHSLLLSKLYLSEPNLGTIGPVAFIWALMVATPFIRSSDAMV